MTFILTHSRLAAAIFLAAGLSIAGTCQAAVNDYNGDRASDLTVYDPGSGGWYASTLSGDAVLWATPLGWSAAVPVPGDYDGDRVSDLAVYGPALGRWYTQTVSTTMVFWATAWGFTDAQAVTGDYDGDRASDLAVFHSGSGTWFVYAPFSASVLAWAEPWGWNATRPVPGDYDGNGCDDLAVFHPGSGAWYIRSLSAGLLAWAEPWGWNGAIPVPGDYDGDGAADLAVFDPSTGVWYIRSLTAGLLAWHRPWGWPAAQPVTAIPTAPTPSLANVRFFAYQLQNQEQPASLQALADSHYDVLLLDQTRSVLGQENYNSAADVARLQASRNSSGGRKKVICYLNIGEAESYRWYWQPGWQVGTPAWIAAPDPDGWDGNYPVQFWNSEWQAIVRESLRRIAEDGYDGIYLDWLEIYEFPPVAQAAAAQGLNVTNALISFVSDLAGYARTLKPGFLVIAQNASALGVYPDYVSRFDAIAQEAVWFDGSGDPDQAKAEGDVPVDPVLTQWYLANLARWQQQGKPVWTVEYALRPENARIAYANAAAQGFTSYATMRRLDALSPNPPPGYGSTADQALAPQLTGP